MIQPNVRIGNNVILWSGNHIGHDSTIGDHVFIASHAVISGNVTIGESSFVGVNATFRDGITVAPRCVIGAGALIMKDTVEGGRLLGARHGAAREEELGPDRLLNALGEAGRRRIPHRRRFRGRRLTRWSPSSNRSTTACAIYFSGRDEEGRSVTGCADFDPGRP